RRRHELLPQNSQGGSASRIAGPRDGCQPQGPARRVSCNRRGRRGTHLSSGGHDSPPDAETEDFITKGEPNMRKTFAAALAGLALLCAVPVLAGGPRIALPGGPGHPPLLKDYFNPSVMVEIRGKLEIVEVAECEEWDWCGTPPKVPKGKIP